MHCTSVLLPQWFTGRTSGGRPDVFLTTTNHDLSGKDRAHPEGSLFWLWRVDSCSEGNYVGEFRNTYSQSTPCQTGKRFHIFFPIEEACVCEFLQIILHNQHQVKDQNFAHIPWATLSPISPESPISLSPFSLKWLESSHFLTSTSTGPSAWNYLFSLMCSYIPLCLTSLEDCSVRLSHDMNMFHPSNYIVNVPSFDDSSVRSFGGLCTVRLIWIFYERSPARPPVRGAVFCWRFSMEEWLGHRTCICSDLLDDAASRHSCAPLRPCQQWWGLLNTAGDTWSFPSLSF